MYLIQRFSEVARAGKDYVSKTAKHYCEEGWDLEYVQFKHKGIKIEVGNANEARIFDSMNHKWVTLNIDFSHKQMKAVFGMEVPLMAKGDLISYKSILGRSFEEYRSIFELTESDQKRISLVAAMVRQASTLNLLNVAVTWCLLILSTNLHVTRSAYVE